MKENKDITSFEEHLNANYGTKGSNSRERFEKEYETFRIGVLIQKTRIKQVSNVVIYNFKGERISKQEYIQRNVDAETSYKKGYYKTSDELKKRWLF